MKPKRTLQQVADCIEKAAAESISHYKFDLTKYYVPNSEMLGTVKKICRKHKAPFKTTRRILFSESNINGGHKTTGKRKGRTVREKERAC